MENGLPLVVFNIKNEGNLEGLLVGERVGTLVRRQREGEKGT
jgi:uridylate kinase